MLSLDLRKIDQLKVEVLTAAAGTALIPPLHDALL